MKIDILGCGSAFSLQKNTSAIRVIDKAGYQLLIDCGPTVPRALWQRGLAVNDIDALFFTHIHPDHCTGLTALLNHWKSFQRTKPLIVWSQPAHRPALLQLASLANWPDTGLGFAIDWRDSTPVWRWQNWILRTAFTRHEIPNLALRIEAPGATLFYSGDGRPTAESVALMEGADLAFQECASATALPDDASHGDFPDCLALFSRLQLPALGLYHCNDSARPILVQACQPHPGLFVSEDGMTFDLPLRREEML